MSWTDLELAKSRFLRNQPFHVDIEWTEFRESIGLRWYLGPLDELLTAEGLGATIDDCLVESAGSLLFPLEQELIDIDSFKEFLDQAANGMLEDNALKAFRLTLPGDAKHRLAGEIYLDLIRRHTMDSGTSRPALDDGCRFVRVFLARYMKDESWDVDWDIQEFSRFSADLWWLNSGAIDHLTLIRNSFLSAADWDTLNLICTDAVERGWVNRLPPSILFWYLNASRGNPRRPDEGPAKRHRPDRFGTKLRNNEIKHTTELLERVGLPKAVACKAIAMELKYAEPTVRRFCLKPYSSLEELRRDGQKRFEPDLYSLMHGPDSNCNPIE